MLTSIINELTKQVVTENKLDMPYSVGTAIAESVPRTINVMLPKMPVILTDGYAYYRSGGLGYLLELKAVSFIFTRYD